MIYETKVSFVTIDKNGNDKQVKQKYIVQEASCFADAEEQTYTLCEGETDLDVIDVKRSKLKEILNARTQQEESIWLAELQDVYTTDEGDEKYIIYKVIFFSKNVNSAMAFISEYIKQGYNLELVSLKKTNYKDVIS